MKIVEKSFAKLLEKALLTSPILSAVMNVMETLAIEVHKMALQVASQQRTINHQQEILQGLYVRQEMMLRSMQEKSLNIALPDLVKEKTSKPN